MKKFLFSLLILLSCGAGLDAMEQEEQGIDQENLEKLLELWDGDLLDATTKYGPKAAPSQLRRKQIQSLIDQKHWVIKNKFGKDIYVRIKHAGELADLKDLNQKPLVKCENDSEERHTLLNDEYVVIDVKKEFPITIKVWKELNKDWFTSIIINCYHELQKSTNEYPYGEIVEGSRSKGPLTFAHLSYKDRFQDNNPDRYKVMQGPQSKKKYESSERYTSLN